MLSNTSRLTGKAPASASLTNSTVPSPCTPGNIFVNLSGATSARIAWWVVEASSQARVRLEKHLIVLAEDGNRSIPVVERAVK